MFGRQWGTGGSLMSIYKYNHERDAHRMGGCDWLPKDKDLCICTAHSGDYFSDYIVVREIKTGVFKMAGEFSAYNFSEPTGRLSKKEFHLLQAGESINSVELKRRASGKG